MKKRKEEAGTPEAKPSATTLQTLAKSEEIASRSPVMERPPQSMVVEPLEESASVGQ